MIDLTPLDVRKKRGDFTKVLRGYEVQQVDSFLELVAERLEELVKENLTLTERVERLAEQVAAQSGREKAVNDALVTAQQLRVEISNTAEREAEVLRSEARTECDRLRAEVEREAHRLRIDAEAEAQDIVGDAERRVTELHHVMRELERRRARFLTNFRQLLERELDTVEVQEARNVDEDMPVDLDLGGSSLFAGTMGQAAEDDAGRDESGEGEARGDEGGEREARGRERGDQEAAEDGNDSPPETEVEATDAGQELFGSMDDEGEARIVDDGIRAEPLGVFDPVENVPPVPDEKPPEQAPWGIDEPEGVPGDAESAERDQTEDDADDSEPVDEVRRPFSIFLAPPASPPQASGETPPEMDQELQLPDADADVHRMASDTRLAPEPPDSGLDWLKSEESEDDR